MTGLNIKELRNSLGLTQADFAKKLGVTPRQVQRWEASDILSKRVIKLITSVFNTTEELSRQYDALEVENNIVQVPYYDNVRVSAGYGIEVFDEEPDGVYDMPEKFFNGHPKNIKCLRVSGDSMYPRFDDGDWVFIAPTTTIRTEGIYVIRVRDALLVKKVQWLPDGIKLISENKDYDTVLLNEQSCPPEDIAIIGKVVLIVSKP